MKVKVLRAAEVAHVLRRALGPMRDWSDCLADMRAKKTDVGGICLLPSGVLSAGCRRPIYHPAAVAEFIKKVRQRYSETGEAVKDEGCDFSSVPIPKTC